MQRKVIKLNTLYSDDILIGVDSIISVKNGVKKSYQHEDIKCTVIESRHAMVTTHYVTETVEQIYSLIEGD